MSDCTLSVVETEDGFSIAVNGEENVFRDFATRTNAEKVAERWRKVLAEKEDLNAAREHGARARSGARS